MSDERREQLGPRWVTTEHSLNRAVFFDSRSAADDQAIRSSLHAKCIVVDSSQVFVSSANFTEAAQERNIEVGLKIESEWLAGGITAHFRHLHEHGLVARAF